MCSADSARKFFDEHSLTWDRDINENQIKRIEHIFRDKLFLLKPPILDLGSGTGVLIPFLKEYGKDRPVIFETDIAPMMLRRAREKYNDKYLHYVLADAHAMPFTSAYFNTVFCFQAYPHFDDKYKTALEIYKTLKSGGKLIILHLMGHKELNEMHRKAGREVAQDRILPASELAELLTSAGFNILRVEEKEDIYLVIAGKT